MPPQHFEITQADVDQVTEEVYVFWRNLLYMFEEVGCPYATYSFLKRDMTLDNAYRTVTWQRGWGKMASPQYDKIKKVVVERVSARIKIVPSVLTKKGKLPVDKLIEVEKRAKVCIQIAELEGYQGVDAIESRAVQLMDLEWDQLLGKMSSLESKSATR